MTIEEIKTLLKRKKSEAIKTADEDHGHNTEHWSSYYSGVAQGLHIAKEIIGMLDKPNKISRKV